MHLQLAERELEGESKARAAVLTAQRVLRSGLDDLRRTVRALHSPPMEARAFDAALALLVADHKTDALDASLQVEGCSRPLPPHVALALYRVAQEALTNVVKHARATRVEVTVRYAEDQVSLAIQDDGIGLGANAEEGFGLRGIRERAHALGGALDLRGSPGLLVQLSIPG